MGHETIVDKKLHLVFKGSNGETKRLTIERPQDELKKIVAEAAMDKISESNLFENEGVLLYTTKKDAYYKMCRVDVFGYDEN
jgi:hypothetical protein